MIDWLEFHVSISISCYYLVYFYMMLIGSEKPLWGEFNKLLYCIVLFFVLDHAVSHEFFERTQNAGLNKTG